MMIEPSIDGSETLSGIGSPPAASEPGLAITVSAAAARMRNRKRIFLRKTRARLGFFRRHPLPSRVVQVGPRMELEHCVDRYSCHQGELGGLPPRVHRKVLAGLPVPRRRGRWARGG